MQRLGLIAGNGRFPFLLADNARKQGVEVVAVALEDEASPELEQHVAKLHWASIAKLGRVIKLLKDEGITQAVMAGGVTKAKLYQRFSLKLIPDIRTMGVLYKRSRDHRDHTLLAAVADEFVAEGIEFRNTLEFLGDHIAHEGCMTKRQPTERERDDVEFGWGVGKAIAEMQIGQTLVVKDKCVVAVEAVEGTDAAVQRGGELARGDAVVIKLSRPNQDFRFDVPTIGTRTIDTLKAAGVSALAVEADKTLMLDKPEVIAAADACRIAIVGHAG